MMQENKNSGKVSKHSTTMNVYEYLRHGADISIRLCLKSPIRRFERD